MRILIINGPNLNMIGKREDAFYGVEDFNKTLEGLKAHFTELEIDYFQSNSEGKIIDCIQESIEKGYQGLIINAGGYSHYSYAIMDALKILAFPILEVHYSNIHAREGFRQKSVLTAVCEGMISGFGKDSYHLALEWFRKNQRKKIGFAN